MKSSNTHRWLGATIALVLLIMPVLLADELSLLANWIFTFICWLIVIGIGGLKIPSSQSRNDKLKDQ